MFKHFDSARCFCKKYKLDDVSLEVMFIYVKYLIANIFVHDPFIPIEEETWIRGIG